MPKRPSKTHKTMRRSYREDYKRELEVPGIFQHVVETFKILFKNWKTFGLLLILMVALNIILVGLMSQDTYSSFQTMLDQTEAELASGKISNAARAGLLLISTVATGGLNINMTEVQYAFAVLIFLLVWLTTIFILRHIMAGHKVKLRDALYNSGTPIVSTFAVLGVVFLQCIPIFLLIIVYAAAVQTNFLATPFYALLFFIFAALMLLLSGYLLSSSLIALVAVTAPGLYPIKALKVSSDLMMSRRVKFIIRLIALIMTLAVIWTVVMLPLILFDMWMKTFEWTANIPFVPICLMIMTCFTSIYFAAYLYLYYRWMLEYDKDQEKND